jgi:hypothetical protein
MMNAAATRRASRPWTPELTPEQFFDRLGASDKLACQNGGNRSVATRKRKHELGGPGHPHPACGEPDYTAEEQELFRAILAWRGRTHRQFPTNAEYLAILRGIGYVKVPHGYKLVSYGELIAAMSADSIALDGDGRPRLAIFNGEER